MDIDDRRSSASDFSSLGGAEQQDDELFRKIAGRFHILLCMESRMLRQCIGYVLKKALKESVIYYTFESGFDQVPKPDVILMDVGSDSMSKTPQQLLKTLPEAFSRVPVIAFANVHDVGAARAAVRAGFRGFLSPFSDLDTTVAAIRLVAAGQVFIPADILSVWADHQAQPACELTKPSTTPYVSIGVTDDSDVPGLSLDGSFTERELEVIGRLKCGKPNKIIAYELDITESTVKVHIRNIMRKLSATNRTQVAFLTREVFKIGSDDRSLSLYNGFTEERAGHRAKPVQ